MNNLILFVINNFGEKSKEMVATKNMMKRIKGLCNCHVSIIYFSGAGLHGLVMSRYVFVLILMELSCNCVSKTKKNH